jgi:hypothetical protein
MCTYVHVYSYYGTYTCTGTCRIREKSFFMPLFNTSLPAGLDPSARQQLSTVQAEMEEAERFHDEFDRHAETRALCEAYQKQEALQ